ncbi:hypothetical protein C8R43DRAFT_1048440 [Mycena crocata]|nr:hypothetical protein C8R43DRAFT_1048440 [Mycena crocata]
MHRALQIPELVESICADVSLGRLALYFLAQVHIFSEPALDRLWNQQSTLVNILLCMPQDLWEINGSRHGKFVRARRAIEPRDWERFYLYARRVKSFWWADLHYNVVDEDTWSPVLEMLAVGLPMGPLFPNLQTLHWSVNQRPWFSYVHLFLAPRIEIITLGILDTPAHFSVLPTLPAQCPLLTSVTLFATPDVNVPHPECSVMIRSLTGLKELDVGSMDRSAFKYLERLPTLEKLALQRALEFLPTPLVNAPQTFPRLRNLGVRAIPHHTLAGLLATNSAWSLTHFLAQLTTSSEAADIAQIYSLLATRSNPAALTDLTIKDVSRRFVPPNFVGEGGIIIDHLSSLFAFRNLRIVRLTFMVGFDLDDTAVESLARAWPRLWELQLGSNVFRSVPPRVTMRSLRALARHCRDLTALTLAFDASVVPEDSGPPAAEQGCLRLLDAGDGVLVDPAPVAAYLIAVFPQLREITSTRIQDDEDVDDEEWERGTTLHELWAEVETLRRAAQQHLPRGIFS